MKKALHMAAFVGSVLSVLVGLDYLKGLFEWGVNNEWHFLYVGGWGARFLHHTQWMFVAILLWMPFRLSTHSNRNANIVMVVGGILFVVAVALEILVSNLYP